MLGVWVLAARAEVRFGGSELKLGLVQRVEVRFGGSELKLGLVEAS